MIANLEAFSHKQFHECFLILKTLDENGISLDDWKREWTEKDRLIREREEEGRRNRELTEQWRQVAQKCPECGSAMRLMNVNTGKRDMVGGGYKTQWVCHGVLRNPPTCDGVQYNLQSRQEIFRDIGWTPPVIPYKVIKGYKAKRKERRERRRSEGALVARKDTGERRR